MNVSRYLPEQANLINTVVDFLNEEGKTSHRQAQKVINEIRINSPADCSHSLEQDPKTAVLHFPAAITFLHSLPFETWSRTSDLEHALYWSGRGICFFLLQATACSDLTPVVESAIHSLKAVVDSWNTECLQIPTEIETLREPDAAPFTTMFPPAAILLNELLEARLAFADTLIFDEIYADWIASSNTFPTKSANWLLFCVCVRNNKSDNGIFRNPLVRQTTFDIELIKRHLDAARHKIDNNLAELIEAQLLPASR